MPAEHSHSATVLHPGWAMQAHSPEALVLLGKNFEAAKLVGDGGGLGAPHCELNLSTCGVHASRRLTLLMASYLSIVRDPAGHVLPAPGCHSRGWPARCHGARC